MKSIWIWGLLLHLTVAASVEKIDLTKAVIDPKTLMTDWVAFDVDAETQSFVLQARGHQGFFYQVYYLEDPNGRILTSPDYVSTSFSPEYNLENSANPSSAGTFSGYATLLVPSNPTVEVVPGKWRAKFAIRRMTLSSEDSLKSLAQTLDVSLVIKKKGKAGVRPELKLRFYFTGARGWDAKNAEKDPSFQESYRAMEDIFSRAGIALKVVSSQDLPKRFSLLPEIGGLQDEQSYQQLFEAIGEEEGIAVIFSGLFRTQKLSLNSVVTKDSIENIYEDPSGVLGISGGIPGPLFSCGKMGRGVVLAVEEEKMREPLVLGSSIAHEIGHFLGLRHIVEIEEFETLHAYSQGLLLGVLKNVMFPAAPPVFPVEFTEEQIQTLKTSPGVE